MKINLDLGNEMSEKCCPAEKPSEDTKKYYPSFHYSGSKPLRIPKEGEMAVRYKKVSSAHSEREDGKEHFNCTIEIREIVSVDSEDMDAPASNKGKESEEALDKIMRDKQKSRESDEY